MAELDLQFLGLAGDPDRLCCSVRRPRLSADGPGMDVSGWGDSIFFDRHPVGWT